MTILKSTLVGPRIRLLLTAPVMLASTTVLVKPRYVVTTTVRCGATVCADMSAVTVPVALRKLPTQLKRMVSKMTV